MEPDSCRYDCVNNGRSTTLPFRPAHELLWKCSIGWIRPTEWFRYTIGTSESRGYVDHVDATGRFFGFQLLKRGNNILTIDRYLELLGRDEDKSNLFQVHAHRARTLFDGLPEDVWPIKFVRSPCDDLRGIPGYRLRPPLTAFLIVRASNVPNEDVDWSVFYQPPE